MWPVDSPPRWVDRSQELATLRAGVEALRQGGCAAVWVEGEPGIGKSSLVVEALAGTGEPGWDIGWGIGREPRPETDVAALVTAMLGTPPEDTLRQLTAQAAGNPLYLRELVDALARERAQPSPAAGVRPAQEQLPASLAALLNDRLSSVSAQTAQILRTAALLDAKFTVTDLAVLLRRPVSELAAGLQEAVAARILVGSGAELAFRHQLIRQALHESMPTALRTALHAEAARELA